MPPHHRSRKSPGAKPLTSQRDQYRALMRQGLSNAAASRIVGVNRKTGHRWRYGRVGHDPHGRGADVPRDHESGAPGVGPVPVRGRADLDRGRSDPWPEPAHDRSRGRSSTVHDQPGDPAKPGRRDRDVSPVPGRAPRCRPPGPSAPSGSSAVTASCGRSWPTTSSSTGARSRSARCWRRSSQTGRRCASRPRRSTRRCTRAGRIACTATACACFGPDGSTASATAGQASARTLRRADGDDRQASGRRCRPAHRRPLGG